MSSPPPPSPGGRGPPPFLPATLPPPGASSDAAQPVRNGETEARPACTVVVVVGGFPSFFHPPSQPTATHPRRGPAYVDRGPGLSVLCPGVGSGRPVHGVGVGEAGAEGGAADSPRFGAGGTGQGPFLFIRRLLLEAHVLLEGLAGAQRGPRAPQVHLAVGPVLGKRRGFGLEPERAALLVQGHVAHLRVAATTLEAGFDVAAGGFGVTQLHPLAGQPVR